MDRGKAAVQLANGGLLHCTNHLCHLGWFGCQGASPPLILGWMVIAAPGLAGGGKHQVIPHRTLAKEVGSCWDHTSLLPGAGLPPPHAWSSRSLAVIWFVSCVLILPSDQVGWIGRSCRRSEISECYEYRLG